MVFFSWLLSLTVTFAAAEPLSDVWSRVSTSVVAVHHSGATLSQPSLNGTGFVIENSNDGIFILTNHHVIAGDIPKKNVAIEFLRGDLDMHTGVIVGYSAPGDVALIRVDKKELGQEDRLASLLALPFGDSDKLTFGEELLAMGHPLTNKNTPTFPKFTGIGFYTEDRVITIRMNGDLGPGNSGGPLFNNQGQVVGMNKSMLPSPAQGVGFAVPANLIRDLILPQLRFGKGNPEDRMHYGSTGIGLQPLDGALMRFLGLDTRSGVIVTRVTESSAAYLNGDGLQRGDIITAVNGQHYDDNPIRAITSLTLFSQGDSIVYSILPDHKIRNGSASGLQSVWKIAIFPQYKTLKEIQNESNASENKTPTFDEQHSAELLHMYLDEVKEGVWISRNLTSDGTPTRTFIREIAYHRQSDGALQFEPVLKIDDIKNILYKAKPGSVLLVVSPDFAFSHWSPINYFLIKKE